jgi:Bifunctional DNA primase/polymerase, N-terminal
MNVIERRLQLSAAGYIPIPLHGKIPPNKKWEQTRDVTRELIEMWAKTWPDAKNTGLLTRTMPTLDLDILNEEAARALEDHVRKRYEEAGHVLVRIGKSPKRAIVFRTIEPFEKITVNLTAPNGSEGEKIEFLASGQQVAAFGTHPDTHKPYRWFGGAPGEIKLDELPYIREDEARALVDELVQLLIEQHGYKRAKERPRKTRKSNGQDQAEIDPATAADDWKFLIDNILAGRDLHESLRDLAAKMVRAGTKGGAAVNQLRALMNASTAPHDERWQERYDDIPRAVETAQDMLDEEKAEQEAAQAAQTTAAMPPSTIDATLAVFRRWLLFNDTTPILAVLGAVAGNYLPGDPVWLGIIGPPSSAKTEILNSTSMLPDLVQAATLTPAGLLSGTPRKQRAAGARGGLLQQLGAFGILAIKDFSSILSMHPETKAELLAALREIYDGAWTRHIGTDGGRTLSWKGKLGVVFAGTGIIDSYHAVIGSMGDRFLLTRLAPAPGKTQFVRATAHKGAAVKQMREELAQAVAQLFASRRAEPTPISTEEIDDIGNTIALVVRLRGAVERDRRTRELEAVYGAEGTGRIGLALERLLAGLDTLGVCREIALAIVKDVAMDSAPPLRRAAYECVDRCRSIETSKVATTLGLPTNSTRRILEDLAAYGLIERQPQGPGKADIWVRAGWEAQEAAEAAKFT